MINNAPAKRINELVKKLGEFLIRYGLAVFTFLATLTLLFTLPGWKKSLGGFPALSGSGGFLLKDVVLLGASLWTLGDSWSCEGLAAQTINQL